MILKKMSVKLTNRDLDILNILWNSPKPLTAAEIAGEKEGLTINTVQAELRKLLKWELVEVAEVVYSGTVLCRSYRASQTAREFALSQFTREFRQLNSEISTSSPVSALLDAETDEQKREEEIQQLEQLLEQYKEM